LFFCRFGAGPPVKFVFFPKNAFCF